MDVLRQGFDILYSLIKPVVFKITEDDPEKAHELFVSFCKGLHKLKLEKLVLDNKTNYNNSPYKISNAAGFNKNADIPPSVLGFFGFDRAVIGTVTYEPYEGNSRPRMKRYPKTKSLVNWEKVPNIGAKEIFKNLMSYEDNQIPLTISLMPTPGKKGEKLKKDLENTCLLLRNIPYVDRFELNISCHNTDSSYGIDRNIKKSIDVVQNNILDFQNLYVKISSDLDEWEVDRTLRISERSGVKGFTIGNSTANPGFRYIPGNMNQGAASGDAVYENALRVQKLFAERITGNTEIIACGGIDSVKKVKERFSFGNVQEIQIFAPLIFSGTGLLRKLRKGYDSLPKASQ